MHRFKCNRALFICQWALVLAQQPCYWPDGSSTSPHQYVNCYSSQDSACCLQGEDCLSNGLCYGSLYGWTYRGACTVKDWSNTTACPVQWCNDVITSSWANLWMCPSINNEPSQWWCGVNEQDVACQSVTEAHFNSYTGGSILGFPPLTSPTSVATITVTNLATTSFFAGPNSKTVTIPASSPVKMVTVSPSSSSPVETSTNSPLSAQTQDHSTSLFTNSSTISHTQEHSISLLIAIGVGLGVPLVITAIGFLGFLCWKEARRQRIRESREPNKQSVTVAIDRSYNELQDTSLPHELGGIGRAELPNN